MRAAAGLLALLLAAPVAHAQDLAAPTDDADARTQANGAAPQEPHPPGAALALLLAVVAAAALSLAGARRKP